MKKHSIILLMVLLSLSLMACAPRITRTNPTQASTIIPTTNTSSPAIQPAASPLPLSPMAPAPSVTASHSSVTMASVTPVPTSSPLPTGTNPQSTSTNPQYIDNPATFTHSETVPRGTPPNSANYPDYDSYLAAYYDHYGRDALNAHPPALLATGSSSTPAPAPAPSAQPSQSAPTSVSTVVSPVAVAQQPAQANTTGNSPVYQQPISNDQYDQIIAQANEAMVQANTALAQAAQTQAASSSSITYNTYDVTISNSSAASNIASQTGGISGTWTGDAVDNVRGTTTGMQLVLIQRDDQIGGEVYFETVNGLEFFGQLQGSLIGTQATMTLRYQDGSYTYFTGDFGASFFTGEYQYMTSTGRSIANGTIRLRRQ